MPFMHITKHYTIVFIFYHIVSPDSGCSSQGNLFGRKGEIHSLAFPNAYPADLHCSWSISVPEGFLVKLHITDLAIVGEAGQCSQDKLTVTDSQQSLGKTRHILSMGNAS